MPPKAPAQAPTGPVGAPPPPWATGIRPYQLEAARWLQEAPCRGRLLAMAPGLGKTLAAIAALRIRHDEGKIDSSIPVITTAIARSDWHREVTRWWPEAKVHIMRVDGVEYRKKGESAENFSVRRKAAWLRAFTATGPGHGRVTTDAAAHAPPTFLIASYEAVRDLCDASIEYGLVFDTIVWDESHTLKESRNVTSILARTLVSKARLNILLTGTPIHNRPKDLFNLLQIMDPIEFPSFMGWAEKFFMVRTTRFGFGRTVDELLDKEGLRRAIASYFFDVTPEAALGELPPRQHYLRRIPVKAAVRISPAKLNGLRHGSGLDNALRSMVSHKMTCAVQLISDLDEPIVAYTYTRKDAGELTARLTKVGVTCTLATGETPTKRRAELIEAWKAGASRVLVCTMDAVRESATLTRAACMVFLDLDWLPGKMLQLQGRIDPARQQAGARRIARYYYLVVEGGPDEVVAERVVEKITEMQGIISTSAGAEGLKNLLKPLRTVVEQTPSEALQDLVVHIEARMKRMEEAGMGSDSALGYE